MKKCLYCNSDLTSKWQKKYCNVSCQNRHQNPLRKVEVIESEYTCEKCGNKFLNKEMRRFCSRKCANSHTISEEMKQQISSKLKGTVSPCKGKRLVKWVTLKCEICETPFEVPPSLKDSRFCSRECQCRNSGQLSAQSRVTRSKNEIYLYELCKTEFGNVLSNERMFNGWDADIILPNFKLAIMWNGKWHYEKITEKHSVAQVQNRDKIKIHEIKEFGYEPYIIKDMGKYNPKFVEEEFEKLKIYIAGSKVPSRLITV